MTWNDNSNGENGFKIERRIGNSTNFSVIGKVDSNTIIYSDSGLLSATMYQYRVKAYIPTGVSQHSNIVEVATKPASLFTMTFPSTAGKTLTYNSTTKTGYMSQYGYSNTITEGTYYMYVRDKSTRYGKLCTKLFQLFLDNTGRFTYSTYYIAQEGGELSILFMTSWKRILSLYSITPTIDGFLFAPGPQHIAPLSLTAAQVTTPAGSFNGVKIKYHFTQTGQYATHDIFEDSYEIYADGVGLITSEWSYDDDDNDPQGTDFSGSGTVTLIGIDAIGIPVLSDEVEPNQLKLSTEYQTISRPGIVLGNAAASDSGWDWWPNIVRVQDVYRFDLATPSTVIIDLTIGGMNSALDLRLYRLIPGSGGTPDQISFLTWDNQPGGTPEHIWTQLASGSYLIGITASSTPDGPSNYTILLR